MRTKRLVFPRILLSILLVAGEVGYAQPSVEDSPRVIKAVSPRDYPPLASAANLGGKVKIDVKIDRAGDVISANLVEGHRLLQDVSTVAALRWKFARSEEGLRDRTAQLTFTFIHWTERKEEERGTTTFIPPYGIELVGRTARIQTQSYRQPRAPGKAVSDFGMQLKDPDSEVTIAWRYESSLTDSNRFDLWGYLSEPMAHWPRNKRAARLTVALGARATHLVRSFSCGPHHG